jgi:hypothetical protein
MLERRGWMMKNRSTPDEEPMANFAQEVLVMGMVRGRQEEHQRACQVMREVIAEIAGARFPLIAALIRERLHDIDSFVVLHQFTFIMSTAWVIEDVLRFLLALDDAQRST